MTPPQRAVRILGLVLTWIGGGISVILLLAVSVGLLLAGYVVGNGIDVGSGRFACRDQACLDDWTLGLAIGLGMTALTVALIVLVVRSSNRSLFAAAAIGSVTATAVVCLALATSAQGTLDGVVTSLLFVAAGPFSLALGSLLRLWARRATSGHGQVVPFDSI